MKFLIVSTIVSLALAACGKDDKPPGERATAASAAEAARPASAVVPRVASVEDGAAARASAPGSRASRKERARAASTVASGPSDAIHTVAKGETLAGIAKSRGLKAADIARWNNVRDPRRLRIGQELRLTAP